MEHGVCNVVYIDRRANDEHVRRETLSDSLVARTSTGNVNPSYFALGKTPPAEVHANVEAILSMFSEGTFCPPSAGSQCLHLCSTYLRFWSNMSLQAYQYTGLPKGQCAYLRHHRCSIPRGTAPQAVISRASNTLAHIFTLDPDRNRRAQRYIWYPSSHTHLF